MKIRFKLVIASLIFFIVFSPISFPALIEYSQASNYEVITEDQEWATDKIVDKDIFIDAEATLTIKKGVTITFNNRNINVYGRMIVAGTMKNPVIFKKAPGSRNYSISVWQEASLVVRNADISGGGGFYPWVVRNNPIMNTTHAEYGSYQGAFHAGGGILSVQGCNFHDNGVAVYVDSESAGKVIVNRSKFFNNSLIDMGYPSNDQNYKVNGRNNWWGSSEGPSNKICNSDGVCKIKGAVDFSNWVASENFHDPVVIIPGIFGSQKEDGVWKIDPIFHVYDNLIDEFKNNGYVVGKDLFIFPYEWRDSNVENAVKLKYEISEIKTIANWPKVDIVAHSMGGLLTRQYIESNAYQGDIDQLITLGTPNNGSPEIYPLWEAGKSIGAVQAGMKKFLEQEMEEGKYVNMFEYIRNRPISSAQELLPNYEYLYDLDNKRPLVYPAEYPVNSFLDNLNNTVNVKKLVNLEYTKIIGKVDSNISTLSGFNIVKVDMGAIWKHGYPLSFEIPIIGERGANNGYGDGTVPLSSAQSVEIPSDNYLELNSVHADLPTKAQKDVLETLTGIRPTSEVTDGMIKNMLQVFVHSPIDVQVISPSGKKYGRDFENNKNFESIDGSFYSGFDTANEFVIIPNPEDGEYRIITQTTGDGGKFRVEAVKISEDETDSSKVNESTVIIGGTAEKDVSGELKIKVSDDTVIDVNAKIEPPVVVLPPVAPPVINQAQNITNSTPSVSKKKSSHKKSKHKKHKKKKTAVVKTVTQVKKVLGISTSKNVKKNPVAKTWKAVVTKKASNVWKSTVNNWKNIFAKPLNFFRR